MIHPPSSRRSAFSLMEVLVALAILLGCVVVLAQLAKIGRSHAESADQLALAQLACQTRLDEMLCGAAPVEPVEEAPLDDLPGWLLSVQVRPLERAGLAELEVTVAEEVLDEREKPHARQFSLVRWIRDPYGARRAAEGFVTEPNAPLAPNTWRAEDEGTSP